MSSAFADEINLSAVPSDSMRELMTAEAQRWRDMREETRRKMEESAISKLMGRLRRVLHRS